jgi:hypothetical protein
MSTKARYRNAILEYYDGVTQERVAPFAPVVFYDDFLGADAVIPAGGSAESGCKWAKKIVGAAPPTVARVADQLSGVAACAMTSASQAQTACLYWDDELGLAPAQGLVFEARVKLSVLPTLVGEIQFGLAGAYNAVPDTVALSMFFDADGSGAINCATDDNSTDSGAIASGVTATAAQWKVYRIDCFDVTDIRFYIDGVRVASGTTFAYADATALQPFFSCYKASGAGLGTIQIDYVRAWQKRS